MTGVVFVDFPFVAIRGGAGFCHFYYSVLVYISIANATLEPRYSHRYTSVNREQKENLHVRKIW
jgi:hypothetical protein